MDAPMDPDRYAATAERMEAEIATVIVGQHGLVRDALTCLFAEGHLLIEGVPGLGKTQLVNVRFRSQAERLGLEAGQTVTRVLLPNAERPPQELLYLPAFLLIAIVVALQWRRREWDQPGMPRRPLAA